MTLNDQVAQQVVSQVKEIARRWGIDHRTGATIRSDEVPRPETTRNDIVSLLAQLIVLAGHRWPSKAFDEFDLLSRPN